MNPAPATVSHVDVAVQLGARVVVVINPMVPIRVSLVPTGHGTGSSLRDKGAMWVANQANRIRTHEQLHSTVARLRQDPSIKVVVVEPSPSHGDLFMHNPASFGARRAILEYAYRTTIDSVKKWIDAGEFPLEETQWTPKSADPEFGS